MPAGVKQMAATAPPGAGPSVDFSSHRPQKVMEKGRRALQRGFGALPLCPLTRPTPHRERTRLLWRSNESERSKSRKLPAPCAALRGVRQPGHPRAQNAAADAGPVGGGVRQAASPKTLRRKKRRIRRYWPGFRVCRKSAGQRPPRLEDSMEDSPAEPYKGSVPGRPYSAGE